MSLLVDVMVADESGKSRVVGVSVEASDHRCPPGVPVRAGARLDTGILIEREAAA
ncbi:hypothetical protein [Kitasatospora sp. NPDC090091]|uniref:hypothetical protein n=1 Tax=Kitasatospora sp. NPDC090091 TaxID=3364081 RepID=UPI003828FE79